MRVNSKKWMVSLLLGCVAMFMFAGLAHSQENWMYWFDNPWYQNKHDIAYDLVVSPSNRTIFLTGKAYRTSSYYYWVTIGIDVATGDTIWTYRYAPDPTDNSGQGNEIIYGPDDYLYIAGFYKGNSGGGESFVILKLDTLGNYVASAEYDRYSVNNDRALTVAYGPDNMIYVGGLCRDVNNTTNFLVRKYNTSLIYQGVMYQKAEGYYNAQCTKVVVAPDTTIWAGGYEHGEQDQWVTYKFNSSLVSQHKFTYEGSASGHDQCQSLTLPWNGDGVYAVGYAWEGSLHNYDITVFKLKQDGTQDWKYQYDRAGKNDKGYAICVDPSGAVYAAGVSTDSTGQDYTVLCLEFGLSWAYIFDGSNHSDDVALDIAINNSGNTIYACGYTNTDHGSKASSNDIMVTRHTLASGTPTWTYIYDGVNGGDVGRDLAIGTDGNIYAGGNITATGSYTRMAAISLPDNFPPTVPELVSPADGGYENNLAVTFTWLASTDPEVSVANYILAYSTDPTFATYDSLLVAGTQTFTTKTLSDITWYWAVRAKDTDGNQSKWSDVWSFQFDLTGPLAPVLTSPIGDGYEIDTTVTFVWQPITFLREVPSPVTYVIQVDTTSGFSSPIKTDTTALTAIDEELLSGEHYYYWHVKAYDAAGNQGPYSDNETFMIDLNPPVIDSETVWEETAFCGPFDCFAKVTDMWGIDGVLLYYKRMEDPAWFSTPMSEGSGDWYLAQIPAGTIDNDTIKYYYYSKDNAEYETRVPPSGNYWFIANSTGIVEENPETPNIFSFDVGSNLIKGKATFNLSLPRSASITLEIYDASGRRIATPATGMRSAGNHTITWTPSTNGIYFYTLKSPFGNKTGKLLCVR